MKEQIIAYVNYSEFRKDLGFKQGHNYRAGGFRRYGGGRYIKILKHVEFPSGRRFMLTGEKRLAIPLTTKGLNALDELRSLNIRYTIVL